MPRNKAETNSRILEAVHTTARDLHDAGFIDKRRMAEFDGLCVESTMDYSSDGI